MALVVADTVKRMRSLTADSTITVRSQRVECYVQGSLCPACYCLVLAVCVRARQPGSHSPTYYLLICIQARHTLVRHCVQSDDLAPTLRKAVDLQHHHQPCNDRQAGGR